MWSLANHSADSAAGMPKRSPSVLIVVLNWNGRSDTLECLASVSKLAYPNYHVLVVDNGSTDGSVEAIETEHPDVEIIENGSNLGYAGGMNVGLRWALARKVDYVLPLNNDVVVAEDALTELVSLAESSSDIGATTPRVYRYFERDVIDNVGLTIDYSPHICVHRGYGEVDRGQYGRVEEVDSFCGSGFLIPTRVLRQVGLFDEEYFAYVEDIDLATRIHRGGFRILYCPGARTWHKVSATSGAEPNNFKSTLLGHNTIRYLRKHGGVREWTIFILRCATAFPVALFRSIERGDLRPLMSKVRGALGELFKMSRLG